jgi:hypothetical protein
MCTRWQGWWEVALFTVPVALEVALEGGGGGAGGGIGDVIERVALARGGFGGRWWRSREVVLWVVSEWH